MKVYRDFNHPARRYRRLVVGIGNFDGVHLGHLRIIRVLLRRAGSRGTPGLITFSPHTRSGGKAFAGPLSTLKERLGVFRDAGIKVCWLVDFSRRFARQDPEFFVREILWRKLGVRGICVGKDHRFGRDRRGNIKLLRALGRELGFEVEDVPLIRVGGRRLSSSFIRSLIRTGRMEQVSRFLGRDYCLSGKVIAGKKLGEKLGYPTANFIPTQLLPAAGVYGARIQLGRKYFPGMAYVGRRPTLARRRALPLWVEAHIFDWKGNLYHRHLKVFLKKRLRGDIKFKNMESLLGQIQRDELTIRRWLNQN